ncbi:MAG: chloride channel protein, partial [Clostridia bacterium]|nr:chloride channel protein [Clostridia bacterium]
TAGVTGGIFLPTLAFGSILGSLCAQALISMERVGAEHYTLIVTLGIVAFLGANSRVPITACVFAIEALGGMHNVFAIIAATTVATLAVEAFGLEDFTDTVINAKIRAISEGKEPRVIEAALTVKKGSFAAGKELRDILWPNDCVVVSFDRLEHHKEQAEIAAGDVLTVRYKTFNPAETAKEFEVLVGTQAENVKRIMVPTSV